MRDETAQQLTKLNDKLTVVQYTPDCTTTAPCAAVIGTYSEFADALYLAYTSNTLKDDEFFNDIKQYNVDEFMKSKKFFY